MQGHSFRVTIWCFFIHMALVHKWRIRDHYPKHVLPIICLWKVGVRVGAVGEYIYACYMYIYAHIYIYACYNSSQSCLIRRRVKCAPIWRTIALVALASSSCWTKRRHWAVLFFADFYWKMLKFKRMFSHKLPAVVGMIHVKALPGEYC